MTSAISFFFLEVEIKYFLPTLKLTTLRLLMCNLTGNTKIWVRRKTTRNIIPTNSLMFELFKTKYELLEDAISLMIGQKSHET